MFKVGASGSTKTFRPNISNDIVGFPVDRLPISTDSAVGEATLRDRLMLGLPVLRFPIWTGTIIPLGVADTVTVGEPVLRFPMSTGTDAAAALVGVTATVTVGLPVLRLPILPIHFRL